MYIIQAEKDRRVEEMKLRTGCSYETAVEYLIAEEWIVNDAAHCYIFDTDRQQDYINQCERGC